MASEDATNAPAEGDAQITFKVKTSGDSNHTITIAETATVLDLKTKLSGDEYEKITPDRMRLIYSGRVMKDPDTLSTYKIKAGNTVHMVKSAASNAAQKPPTTASPSAAAGVPTNMAAGTANNPLAGLTGARYAGHVQLPGADMFGADGGMGPPPSEDQIASMLEDPNVQQTMNEALNNPAMVDMMINSIPGLANDPNARAMFQSPEFRRMMTNPEAIRQAAAMRRMMGGGQGGSAFPAPGVTDTTPAGAPGSTENPSQASPFNMFGQAGAGGGAANPFGSLLGGGAGAGAAGGAGANPFAALFGNRGTAGQAPSAPGSAASTNPASDATNPAASLFGAGNAGTNPFQMPGMPQMTPEMMQQAMQMVNSGQFNDLYGGGGFAGMGAGAGAGAAGASSTPQPADTRPPEERYAEQLRQLNDMGFFDFDQNVAALRRSGGSVQGAIEQLLR